MDFLHDLIEFDFLQNALLAITLAAVAAGAIGSLVAVRRSTYFAGAISHSVLAGLGLSLLLSRRWGLEVLSPTMGALLAAVAAALLLTAFGDSKRLRRDTLLSAVWTGAMALGVVFVAATPGYRDDLESYLFGSLLLVTQSDLVGMAILDAVVLLLVIFCFNRFHAIAFNAELARLRGVNVHRYEAIFHVATALTVVLLVRVAGIVLAVALLTLPAAAAGLLTRRLNRMMALAAVLTFALSLVGLFAAYEADLPPGGVIVLVALAFYALVAVVSRPR